MEDEGKFPRIMGFNSTSEAGFNIHAASIFLFGCNFRCPYCMNGRIVVVKEEDLARPVKSFSLSEIKEKVIAGKHEWVQISGGEPTLTPLPKLLNLLEEIKSWGCKIGMSTNGTYPHVLEKILPYLSYVAMDLKSCNLDDFEKLDIVNKKNSFLMWLNSKRALFEKKMDDIWKLGRNVGFDYEIRTTVYPKYVSKEGIKNIGFLIHPDDNWVFQQFRHAKNMLTPEEALNVKPYSEEEFDEIINFAKRYTNNVHKRYV